MKEKEKRTAGSGGRPGIRNTGRINDKKDGKDQTGGFQWEIYP